MNVWQKIQHKTVTELEKYILDLNIKFFDFICFHFIYVCFEFRNKKNYLGVGTLSFFPCNYLNEEMEGKGSEESEFESKNVTIIKKKSTQF